MYISVHHFAKIYKKIIQNTKTVDKKRKILRMSKKKNHASTKKHFQFSTFNFQLKMVSLQIVM